MLNTVLQDVEKSMMEDHLHRLFFAFPRGLPGLALLLPRVVFGLTLLLQGRAYLTGPNVQGVAGLVGLTSIVLGGLLLIGFLTPVVGAIVAFGILGVGFSILPACTPALIDSTWSTVFAMTILVQILLLGPGSFSVDARMFGRREIIIPRGKRLES